MLCMVRTKTINVVAVNRTNRHNKQSKWLTDWKSPRFCMCVCCILYICGSCMKLLAHKWCCKIHICQTYLRTHAQTLLFQQTKTLQLQRTNSKFKACATFSRFGERVAHPCIIHFGPVVIYTISCALATASVTAIVYAFFSTENGILNRRNCRRQFGWYAKWRFNTYAHRIEIDR